MYNPEVRVFEVFDADGQPLALFYCDYFKRDNKRGGAWMSNFVDQSRLLGNPAGRLQRLQLQQARARRAGSDQLSTMSPPCSTNSATRCTACFADSRISDSLRHGGARDFVEFPSQFNEHWATYPEVFRHYAKHYKTGAPMPAELAEKIKKSATFNQGYALTEIAGGR